MIIIELQSEKEYKLQELVLFLIEHLEAIDNNCVYTLDESPEATHDLVCYIDTYPEVTDEDEEVYSKFVLNKQLEHYISGQHLSDIVGNTLHQKKNACIDDYLKNIDYYLKYDTFFDFM